MNKLNTALTTGAVTAALLLAAGAAAQDDANGDVAYFEATNFSVDEFDVDGFVGTVEIIVEDRQGIEVSAYGPADRMDQFEVSEVGDAVEISFEEDDFRWNDWSTWFGWWRNNTFEAEDYPVVMVRLPAGTPVDVEGMTGNFTAGDLMGPLEFGGAGAVEANVGDLRLLDLSIAGAADVSVGHVSGPADVSISGAGDVSVLSAQATSIALRGAGNVTLGAVRGGLDVSISGMGDVEVASVDGPVDISLAGAGDVDIAEGRASRFDVSIAGAGDVHFGGTAVDPDISIAGAGDVYIEAYEGRLRQSGMGDVTIGSGS